MGLSGPIIFDSLKLETCFESGDSISKFSISEGFTFTLSCT